MQVKLIAETIHICKHFTLKMFTSYKARYVGMHGTNVILSVYHGYKISSFHQSRKKRLR